MLFRKKNACVPARPRLWGKVRDSHRMDLKILGSAAFLLAAIIIHATTSVAYFTASISNTENAIIVGRFFPQVCINGVEWERGGVYTIDDVEANRELTITVAHSGSTLPFKYILAIQLSSVSIIEDSVPARIHCDNGQYIDPAEDNTLIMIDTAAKKNLDLGSVPDKYIITFDNISSVEFKLYFVDYFVNYAGLSPVPWPDSSPVPVALFNPMIEFEAEPETEPETELTTEPVTESTTELTTEPITEYTTEPVTEPITEPTTEPASELDSVYTN